MATGRKCRFPQICQVTIKSNQQKCVLHEMGGEGVDAKMHSVKNTDFLKIEDEILTSCSILTTWC